MDSRVSSSSRGIFATPGSRSFTRTPSLCSVVKQTPKNTGSLALDTMSERSQKSASCVQKDARSCSTNASFEMGTGNKLGRTPIDGCNIYKRTLVTPQDYVHKRRSVIYTTPDEGNESHSSSFIQNVTSSNSVQSTSGLLVVNFPSCNFCQAED